MGAADNKALIADTFAKWAEGDGNAFFRLLDDDVKWTVIGTTPVSKTYESRAAFLEGAVQPLTGRLSGAIEPKVVNLIAEDDWVSLQWRGQGSMRSGKPYNQTYSWVMRLQDGKVVEGTAYLDTELINAVWEQ